MADESDYIAVEREYLKEYLKEDEIEKVQRYAKKYADKEIERSTYQAMEAFIHNLNTMHSRAGAQTPFSSINYGMDTTPEGRMVMKNIMLATEAGLGHGETPIFPIQIFRVKDGVNLNPGEPNYDLFKLCKKAFPELLVYRRPVQSPVLRSEQAGDGDCVHGLPHKSYR